VRVSQVAPTVGVLCLATVAMTGGLALFGRSEPVRGGHAEHEFWSSWQGRFPLGERLPTARVERAGRDMTAESLIGGKWTFLIRVPEFHQHDHNYASVLLKRFGADHLQFVYIYPKREAPKVNAARTPAGVVVTIDAHGDITTLLKAPDDYAPWTWLLDRDGRVRFSWPRYLNDDSLRQLTETALSDRVRYSPADQSASPTELPDAAVRQVAGTKSIPLSRLLPRGTWFLFFRANCTTCGTAHLFAKLNQVQAIAERDPSMRVVPVFSKAFAGANLQELALAAGIHLPIYVADEYFENWEDPYMTIPSAEPLSRIIQMGPQLRPGTVKELDEWIALHATDGSGATHSGVKGPPRLEFKAPGVGTSEGPRLGTVLAGKESTLRWVHGISTLPDGTVSVLDGPNHRIVVYSQEGRLIRQIGAIGQGSHQLFQPLAMTTDSAGAHYVINQDSGSVQVLAKDGAGVTSFPIDVVSDSIAVTSEGNILLNSPRDGQIVSVWSRSGRKIRSFGTLVDRSRGYPGRSDDRNLQVALNRAYLSVDPADDSVYAAFQFMPLVQKYSAAGILLWERRLESPQIIELERTFFAEPGARRAESVKSMDGHQFPRILTAIASRPRGGVLVALSTRSIFVLNSDGVQARILTPEGGPSPGTYQGLALLQGHRLLVAGTRTLHAGEIE
jgi:hypothetical protein